MEDFQNDAQETEDIVSEGVAEETAETIEENTQEDEQTIAELEGEEEPEQRVVSQNAFVAEKKARKAVEKELKALQESISHGQSLSDIDVDVNSIAEEFDTDPAFIQRLVDSATAKLDQKYSDKLSAKERAERFETAFDKQMAQALDRGPEFKSIANANVIKSLAKIPENKNKTVSQLLEETYGNALTGKRTIETRQPAGGNDPEPLDLARAEKDIAYFNEIMKSPKKKAQYNANMLTRGF